MDKIQILKRIKNKVKLIDDKEIIPSNSVNDVIKRIKRLHTRNSLVPVICEDMYVYEHIDPDTQNKTYQSLHSFLVEKIIDKYNDKHSEKLSLTNQEINDIIDDSYFGMSLLRRKVGENIYEEIYETIFDENDNLYPNISLKQEVIDFLKLSNFSLIITTSCYPILEKELGEEYISYYNHLEIKNDKPLPSKCIYHIFGKAKLEDDNWGFEDKQLLRYLRSSFSSEYRLSNLHAAITKGIARKSLFVLGNVSPDWLFRFILTPIYGGDVYDNGKGFYISDELREDPLSLELFLQDIKFEKESNLISVLKGFAETIKKSKNTINNNQFKEKKYDFFISHTSHDNREVKVLVETMRNAGLNVWVDYENIKDGDYWERINNALNSSTYFMPFVTEQFIYRNKKKEYLNKIFNELKININALNSESCIKLEKYLDGIQIELLLASSYLSRTKFETFSIPVILEGSSIFIKPIDMDYLRDCSEDSILLPKNLFWGLHMYYFNPSNPNTFSLDFNRYKRSN